MSKPDRKNILADLDSLIKKASQEKATILKSASIGDDAKDGTSKPTTGAQHAANVSDAKEGTAAMAAGGAKTNPVGASVENDASHDAKAVSTDGNKGAEAGVLAVKNQAHVGGAPSIQGDDKKTKTAGDLVVKLREASKADEPVAKVASTKNLTGHLFKTASDRVGEGLVRFLGAVKTAAEGGSPEAGAPQGDAAPAGPEAGAGAPEGGHDDAAAQQIIQAIESGQLSEEDAQKLLEEAAQSGAISPEDLQAAMAELQHAQGGQGAPGGAPDAGAGAPPAAPAGPEAGAPAADGQQKLAMAKIAQADIGPEHPEYMKKLASLHEAELQAGYSFGAKIAEFLTKSAEDEKHEAGESAKVEKLEHELDLEPKDEKEKEVLGKVKGEMGVDDKQLAGLMSAKTAVDKLSKTAQYEIRLRKAILCKTAELLVAQADEAAK